MACDVASSGPSPQAGLSTSPFPSCQAPSPIELTVRPVFPSSRVSMDSPQVDQTETCLRLSLVNGERFQSCQRSRSRMPARRAIKSSSAGHT